MMKTSYGHGLGHNGKRVYGQKSVNTATRRRHKALRKKRSRKFLTDLPGRKTFSRRQRTPVWGIHRLLYRAEPRCAEHTSPATEQLTTSHAIGTEIVIPCSIGLSKKVRPTRTVCSIGHRKHGLHDRYARP